MSILQFIWGFIASIVGALIMRIVAAIGLTFLSFTGIDILIEDVKNYIFNAFDAIPEQVIQLVALCGFGIAINTILAAMTAVVTYKIFIGFFNAFKFGGNN